MLKEGKRTVLRMRDLGALVTDNVPIPSIEHIRHDSIDLMMEIIRKSHKEPINFRSLPS